MEKDLMRSITLTAGLMLALTSAALADTTRCTTRYDEALQRWVTECTDGSRAITRYDAPFNRYRTDVITPPKDHKAPRGWSVPGKPSR
jgi:hypothetical protein